MISRRDLVGAGAFCAAATLVSTGAVVAQHMQSSVPVGKDGPLEYLPPNIGGWHHQPAQQDMIDPVVTDIAFAQALALYDGIVARDYVAQNLPRVMLNIAYMRRVEQESRFHWPELCYASQGFNVSKLPPVQADIGGRAVGVARFMAERVNRHELVHYVMRIGRNTPVASLAVRMEIFRESLAMRVPDGTMLRTSLLLPEPSTEAISEGSDMLLRFLNLLIAKSDADLRAVLV
ncbi:MAG: EpsI family protein [Sphingobium sp.]